MMAGGRDLADRSRAYERLGMSRAARVWSARVLVLTVAFGFLELGPRSSLVDPLVVLPLSEMVAAFIGYMQEPSLWTEDAWVTGSSVVVAFVSAVLLGILFGAIIWRIPHLEVASRPYLISFYAVPFFAFYPVLLVIFGTGRTPVVLLAIGWAMPTVILPTVEGLNRVRTAWTQVGDVYNLGAFDRWREIQWPAILPGVYSGIRLSITYTILAVVASEFILSSQGMGAQIAFHYNNFRNDLMWAALILVLLFMGGIYSTVVWFVGRAKGAQI